MKDGASGESGPGIGSATAAYLEAKARAAQWAAEAESLRQAAEREAHSVLGVRRGWGPGWPIDFAGRPIYGAILSAALAGPSTLTTLARAVGRSADRINSKVRRLVRDGYLRRDGLLYSRTGKPVPPPVGTGGEP